LTSLRVFCSPTGGHGDRALFRALSEHLAAWRRRGLYGTTRPPPSSSNVERRARCKCRARGGGGQGEGAGGRRGVEISSVNRRCAPLVLALSGAFCVLVVPTGGLSRLLEAANGYLKPREAWLGAFVHPWCVPTPKYFSFVVRQTT